MAIQCGNVENCVEKWVKGRDLLGGLGKSGGNWGGAGSFEGGGGRFEGGFGAERWGIWRRLLSSQCP